MAEAIFDVALKKMATKLDYQMFKRNRTKKVLIKVKRRKKKVTRVKKRKENNSRVSANITFRV